MSFFEAIVLSDKRRHIRPMPDACVDLWKTAQDILDPKEMYDICRTDFMYNRWGAGNNAADMLGIQRV